MADRLRCFENEFHSYLKQRGAFDPPSPLVLQAHDPRDHSASHSAEDSEPQPPPSRE
jgi:hypothetical protein